MTTISSTDHKYENVEFTMGMESGRFFTSKAEDFEKKAEKKDCFERIPDDKPVKFYFDIDHKFPTEGLDMGADVLKEKADGVIQIYNKYLIELFADWVPQVVPIINFGESHFEHKMVGDVDKWGLSFHVVVLNICAYKNMIGDMAGIFNDHIMDDQNSGRSPLFTTYLPSFSEAFDTKVYSAGKQKIRCIHASKEDENRPFRLQKGTFEDMMITAFIPPDAITLEDRKEASIEAVKTTVGETRKKARTMLYSSRNASIAGCSSTIRNRKAGIRSASSSKAISEITRSHMHYSTHSRYYAQPNITVFGTGRNGTGSQ